MHNVEQTSTYLEERRRIVEGELAALIEEPTGDSRRKGVDQAMRYSLNAGGKRLRPALAMASADAVGAGWKSIMPLPLALELIHTYSLIHDDLPCMDDDDLRRGMPSCHRQFDEATAVLAGDALLTKAFELLSDELFFEQVGWRTARTVVQEVSMAAGHHGMVGGQIIDMASENTPTDLEQLTELHRLKTGALLRVSVVEGGRAAGASPDQLQALETYGECIGLAFQIVDDILDETVTSDQLGKPGGSDREQGKTTFPLLLGLEESRQRAEALVSQAIEAIEPLGAPATPLKLIAERILNRLN